MSDQLLEGEAAVDEVRKLFAAIADYHVQPCYFERETLEDTAADFIESVKKGDGLKLYAVAEPAEAEPGRTICITGNGPCSEAHARLFTFVLNNQQLVRDAVIAKIRRGA